MKLKFPKIRTFPSYAVSVQVAAWAFSIAFGSLVVLGAEHDRTILSVIAAVVVLTISLLAWLAVIRNLQNSRAALMTSMSELKRSEEALQRAEGYRSLFQHANDSIIIFEPDTEVVLEVNDKACEVYEFSRDEFIGKSLKELSQDIERGEEQLAQLLATGSLQSYESVNFRSDGTPLIFLINASVIEYNGKPAILSINRDITERRWVRDALQKNLSLLSSTFEATADGILAVDLDNNIISANKKFIEMWDIPEKLQDMADSSLIIDHHLSMLKDPEKLVARIERSLQRPEEISFSNLELLDGRIIERYTQPQMLNGKTVGRVMSFRDITERERTGEVLKESEARYRDLFENANDIIYVHDLEGNYVSINQAAERVIGYTREEIRLMNMDQIVAPEHLEMIRQKLAEKTAGGVKHTAYEVDCIAKDGHRLTLEVNSRVIYRDMVPVAVQGIARNITERKQTQEVLRIREEQYRDLYENANDLIYTHDLKGNFTSLNRAGEVITGYKREEAMKMNLSQVVAPEFLEAARAMTTRKVAGEAPGTYELEIVAKEGNRVSLELSTRLIIQDGKPVGVQGIGRDITERKRADSALRESEYKLRTLLDSMSEGLLQVDTEDRILFVNNCLCEMVGYSQEELIDTDWSLLLLDEGRDFIKTVNERRRKGIADTYEICLKKKSGELIWTMVGGVPMVNAEGVVSGSMGVFTDITERKRAEEQLLYDAFHDGLTGLANRALFMDHLQLTIERGKRKPESLYGILFLDFDRFKVINDSLGHAEGDKLLKLVAERLESSLRPGDLVARLGGDEFTILLNELEDESDARRIAERIQEDLKVPFVLSGREVFSSVSIGIALSSAGQEKAEDMLRHADIAMYSAKAKGKAQHQVFDQEMHRHAVKQLEIETEMRYALERGDFCLHYQPIFNLETRNLVGFEALIRWNHPERGMIAPGEFIPVAEENGLIFQLGQWTVHESCRQMRHWQSSNPAASALTVSVNLSCREFLQLNLAEQVAATLSATQLDPGSLKLEITESHIMENSELAIKIMNRLRILGVEMSLDDFGTGYSSLSYLHRLPVSYLKIDRSFINQMVENGENREIVHTIIKLAQNLKMKVVAEGIETADQLEHLSHLQCDYGQGYFFSRPLAAGAVEAFIEENIESMPFVIERPALESRLEM